MKYVIYVVVVLGAITAAVLALNKFESRIDKAGFERGQNELRAEYAAKAQQAEAEQRKTEQERQRKLTEVLNESSKQTEAAKADATRAKSAANSLRDQLAAAREREASRNPAACPRSKTEELVGELLIYGSERLNYYAAEADAARVAGLTCERQYESLQSR